MSLSSLPGGDELSKGEPLSDPDSDEAPESCEMGKRDMRSSCDPCSELRCEAAASRGNDREEDEDGDNAAAAAALDDDDMGRAAEEGEEEKTGTMIGAGADTTGARICAGDTTPETWSEMTLGLLIALSPPSTESIAKRTNLSAGKNVRSRRAWSVRPGRSTATRQPSRMRWVKMRRDTALICLTLHWRTTLVMWSSSRFFCSSIFFTLEGTRQQEKNVGSRAGSPTEEDASDAAPGLPEAAFAAPWPLDEEEAEEEESMPSEGGGLS